MRMPPMVGVPFLVNRWLCGPFSRIGWPSPWQPCKKAINLPPQASTTASAVKKAAKMRIKSI